MKRRIEDWGAYKSALHENLHDDGTLDPQRRYLNRQILEEHNEMIAEALISGVQMVCALFSYFTNND